jgi:hypothetical protein
MWDLRTACDFRSLRKSCKNDLFSVILLEPDLDLWHTLRQYYALDFLNRKLSSWLASRTMRQWAALGRRGQLRTTPFSSRHSPRVLVQAEF